VSTDRRPPPDTPDNDDNDGQPSVWIIRHGETEWSRTGQHTSRTELGLLTAGERQARALRPVVAGARFDLVLCSPRLRAQQTAELAGLVPYVVTDDLREWDYGDLEGLTTADIQERIPGWSIWDGPWPGGETAGEVGARADRVLAAVLASGAGRVALVGHGHFSRVVAARWVGTEVSAGRWLCLDTGTVSELGWVREDRVVHRWNVPAASTGKT
jgi:broad specificity phosphatase PhoE